MWSLPDINRMNAEAAKESKQIERALKTGKHGGKKIRCDSAEYDREHCGGEVYLDPWYDIFSDDPKGISGRGVEEIKQTLRELQSEGATRALLILDAAYQFAVSIGVYAEVEKAVSA